MKKIKSLLLILTCAFLVVGCGEKTSQTTSTKNEETLTEVQTGIYIGEANETTGYVPKLTLNDDKTYEFKISKPLTYNGSYHVDNNMLILTLSEDKSFTFSSKDGKLSLNEEIPNTITKGTKFSLWGSFTAEVIEKEEPEEESTEETVEENQ